MDTKFLVSIINLDLKRAEFIQRTFLLILSKDNSESAHVIPI